MTNLTAEFRLMAQCLFVAYRALQCNETPVACMLVDEMSSRVVSVGFNDTNRSLNGTRHAEFLAVEAARSKLGIEALSGLTLFVSVEPCIMCAAAMKQLRIKRVVYGCGNDRFGGNGTVLLIQDNVYQSYPGILRTEAVQLLRNFYIQENDSAPDPQIKKNKDLESKEYPNMVFRSYMNQSQFEQFYGSERLEIYNAGGSEITPVAGLGYTLTDLLTTSDVLALPQLDYLYPGYTNITPAVIESDLEQFFMMFYDVDNNGHVQFTKSIVTTDSDTKRRKLS